jgi:hypothetical protein
MALQIGPVTSNSINLGNEVTPAKARICFGERSHQVSFGLEKALATWLPRYIVLKGVIGAQVSGIGRRNFRFQLISPFVCDLWCLWLHGEIDCGGSWKNTHVTGK